MTSVTLYELADMRDVLDNWLSESEGEVTPELQELLDGLEIKVNEKIERVALYAREQIATALAIDEEVKRLTARAAAKKKAAEGLKAYLMAQMDRLNVRKVEGLLCNVAIQNNPPAVTTALEPKDLYALDDARPFVKREEKVVYSIERDAILAAWKASQPLPAAIVVRQGQHIRIR